ncbi:MAG: hypothetical protein WAU88_13235 [Candidatus Zixiibacteriota bacterium]
MVSRILSYEGRYHLGVLATFAFFCLVVSSPARDLLPASKAEALTRRQQSSALATPKVDYATHSRGKMVLAVANNGTFGTYGQAIADPFTGAAVPSCIYPRNSDLVYLWVGAFWIGAIVGRDTLVSVGTEDFYETQEFWPEPVDLTSKYGNFKFGSMNSEDPFYDPKAYSEQDIYCEYTDTNRALNLTGQDPTDGRGHIPLGIKVRQRSTAWSFSYADDFVLFDYNIENIGLKTLRNVYMGIWVDGDVWHTSRNGPQGWNDDIVGLLPKYLFPDGCGEPEDVNIAYHADNDGDPEGGAWDYRSTRSAVGTRVIRTPSDSLKFSFNWWIINYSDATLDFGPRLKPPQGELLRDMEGRLGTPLGDRNKYYLMKNEETDYDLLFTGIDHSEEGWLGKPTLASTFAKGYDTRYLLSFGPFALAPGQQLPISFAWVGGENFHQNPTDFQRLFRPDDPGAYYNTLNFDNLAENSRWAYWVYDNPGVDTDGDGFRGKFCIRSQDSVLTGIDTIFNPGDTVYDSLYTVYLDTFWYAGDGIPDFKGAGPPPAPLVKIIPDVGKMTVRWNGYFSENTPDVFLHKVDFEGYRVYTALDNRYESFALVSSHDREDYNMFTWKRSQTGQLDWVLDDIPFTKDSLRLLFDKPNLQPLAYSRQSPLGYHDSLYYFERQDYNASNLNDPMAIHRAYPDAPRPSADSAFWTEDEVTYEHGKRLPKYYEYEYNLNNLLPTVPYYVAVTAFDFGSPKVGLAALETEPSNNAIREFAMTTSDSVVAQKLDAYVYPNPYREDGRYEADQFENRLGNLASARAHRLHFANLPKICTIRIYTLDGDLVGTIEHNFPSGGPGSMHDEWNMITRNTQEVVSGLYYWVVQSADRTQLGKVAIIR